MRRPVVVLNTAPGAFHHGDLCLTRSLGRLGIPTYIFQNAPVSLIARSRYARGTLRWNFAAHPEAANVEQLLDVGHKIGGQPVLIPTDDAGAILVADHAETLSSAFRFPAQPPGLTRALASKKDMFSLCERLGIPTPDSVFPASKAEVLAFLEHATFPVVVKSIDARFIPWLRGGQSVFIAHTIDELLNYYDLVEQPDQPNLMFQEFIAGGPDSNWLFNGYFNADSDCLIGFTGQKIRQYPHHTGATSLGVCVANPFVEDAARQLLKRIGYRGIVDLGFRYDRRDGTYRLLDANPRIGSTFRLFFGANGLDVARALYLDLTGASVSATAGRPGRRWVVENYDLLAAAAHIRDGALPFDQWMRSFRRVEEGAWFAWDDPVPFVLMCALFPAKLARTALKNRVAASRAVSYS